MFDCANDFTVKLRAQGLVASLSSPLPVQQVSVGVTQTKVFQLTGSQVGTPTTAAMQQPWEIKLQALLWNSCGYKMYLKFDFVLEMHSHFSIWVI